MSLCKNCDAAFAIGPLSPMQRQYGIFRGDWTVRSQHSSAAEYLDAVQNNCYVCWRYHYQQLSNAERELISKLNECRSQLPSDTAEQGSSWDSDTTSTSESAGEQELDASWLFRIHIRLGTASGGDLRVAMGGNAHYVKALESLKDDGTRIFDDDEHARFESMMKRGPRHGHVDFLPAWDGSTGQRFTYSAPISLRSDSPRSFELVQAWIERCNTQHQSCMTADLGRPWHPTRLLDVGVAPLGKSDAITECRLVFGASIKGHERYVTLSHRWGSWNITVLTADNHETFKGRIPLDCLPQTFLDCMLVARKLGIRYVWIDSLCIIQTGDDGQDWTQEASTMDLVYRNAYCNVSASWATPDTGLFVDRNPHEFRQLLLDIGYYTDKNGDNVMRRTFESAEGMNKWIREVRGSPLNCRGWVLQERLLSRRNICFCRQEIIWECSEATCGESFPDLLPPFPNDLKTMLFEFSISSSSSSGNCIELETSEKDQLSESLCSKWARIAMEYNTCQLTKWIDKLAALAGMAQHMKPMFQSIYVAGLWLRYLPHQLSFWVFSPAPQQQDDGYVAPTFSWASIPASSVELDCHFRANNFVVLSDVSLVKYRQEAWSDEPITNDIFGPMTKTEVELRVIARLIPASIRFEVDPSGEYGPYQLSPEGCDCTAEEAPIAPIFLDYEPSASASAEIDELCRIRYYYFPLRRNVRDLESPTLDCIVLKLEDAAMGRFSRVGLFKAEREDLLLDDWGHEREVESWSFNEETGEQTFYVI